MSVPPESSKVLGIKDTKIKKENNCPFQIQYKGDYKMKQSACKTNRGGGKKGMPRKAPGDV